MVSIMEVYHLRHAHRNGKNKHISQEGLKKANQVGSSLPSFNVVLSSISIRAVETTIAMGFAINDTINFENAELKDSPPSDSQQHFDKFEEFNQNIQEFPYYKQYSNNLVQLLTNALEKYQHSEKILIISNGGVIEYRTIGYLPNLDYTEWGSCVENCQGVKLEFENLGCISGSNFILLFIFFLD